VMRAGTGAWVTSSENCVGRQGPLAAVVTVRLHIFWMALVFGIFFVVFRINGVRKVTQNADSAEYCFTNYKIPFPKLIALF
jgi:hypothetical protein